MFLWSDRFVSAKLRLLKDECYCGIPELYKKIAKILEFDTANAQFDCRKIRVTQSVQDQIFAFYKKKEQASDMAIGMCWVNYGPKADLEGDEYLAEVEDDFISWNIPQF